MNGKNPRPRPYSPKKHDEGYCKIDWSKKGPIIMDEVDDISGELIEELRQGVKTKLKALRDNK